MTGVNIFVGTDPGVVKQVPTDHLVSDNRVSPIHTHMNKSKKEEPKKNNSDSKESISKTLAARECHNWISKSMTSSYLLIGCGILSCIAVFLYSGAALLSGIVRFGLGIFFL